MRFSRRSFSLASLLPLLLAATCQPHAPAAPPGAPADAAPPTLAALEGTWLNAHEENHGDTLVYRPSTYKFPPARGRTGFRIGAYGRFEQFDIAPTDGLLGRPGTWTAEAGNARLRIHLADGSQPDYALEVLGLEKQVLTVRRR